MHAVTKLVLVITIGWFAVMNPAIAYPANNAATTLEVTQFPNAPFPVATVSDAGFPITPVGIEMHLIELSSTDRIWLSEKEVWQLKRARISFMDVTFHQN